MTDMKNIIKKMPKYKKEMANHATFFTLAEDCMNAYGKGTYHTSKCSPLGQGYVPHMS